LKCGRAPNASVEDDGARAAGVGDKYTSACIQEDRMPEKSVQRRTTAAKAAKPARKRVSTRKPKVTRLEPDHGQISERAYYIYLDEGQPNELANWLRAERELTAA
jgi:Protein of unknown function (DUF2934)